MHSIMTEDMEHCYICGSGLNIEMHHVFFGTADRKNSDKFGLIVPLCVFHHRGKAGAHFDRDTDLFLKRRGQSAFCKIYSKELYMEIFGKSYE